jgi:hypothetical protein
MAKKFGGKTFAAENDFKVTSGDPWKASASGHGYQGERFNDDTGFERGLGAYADDDKAFRKPSQSQTDSEAPLDIFNEVANHSGPAGVMLTGGGPVKEIGGGSGPPRFKPKSSKQARDDQSNGGL